MSRWQRLFGFSPQAPDKLSQPLCRGGALFPPRFAAAGVCQLLRDFREVDL
jgi:hypothetical protein